MYTNDEIDQETLRVLLHAAPGKDPDGRPKALCTYQICNSYDDEMAMHFISSGGVGGSGGGSAGPAFTQVVQYSLKRLSDRGLVRHFYMDTRGLVFEIKGYRDIRPSYPVMAVYQYIGDLSTASIGRTEVKIGARSSFTGPSATQVRVHSSSKPMQIDASTVGVNRRRRNG